ncbi:MAG: hypothetical protein LBI64_00265 [Coriobacteriales bacterium]|jgi:trigger factor|nr:hypothetical protein [Coriobacteriales bacterium]
MKVKKSTRENGRIELAVTAPANKVDEAITFVEFRLALENHIDPSQTEDLSKAIIDKIGEAYYKSFLEFQIPSFLAPFAVDQEGLEIIMAPEVVPGSVSSPPHRDRELEFKVLLTLKPSYELDDYGPVTIKVPKIQVTEAEIDDQLLKLADNYATYEKDADRPVQANDHILFSIAAKNSVGEEIPGFTAERRLYSLGKNFMPPEFDAAIIGMDRDETRSFDVTGPNVSRKQATDGESETLTFTVTLLEIQKRVIPAITDAWVAENIPGQETVPQLREAIRQQGLAAREQQQMNMRANLVASEFAKRFKGSIPDEFYEFTRDELMQNLQQSIRQQGRTFEEFVAAQGGEQQFSMTLMMRTREVLTQTFSLDALARHLGLVAEPADIEETYRIMAPGHEKEARLEFEQTGRNYLIREAALRNKANRWLVDNATVETYE